MDNHSSTLKEEFPLSMPFKITLAGAIAQWQMACINRFKLTVQKLTWLFEADV